MIKSFSHKGLEVFFRSGSTKGIQAKHADRLGRILDRLDAAAEARDMNAPGYDLHPLKGNLAGHWSVKVSGNWRVTFRMDNGNAHIVNYQDYH
ncbi:MAG: type II toxin-antitoxin system RelE/ParE family toxin [Pseudodesulfovibrio sp.]|uniref:Plasmid maintenance system killer n=1 Tax=Pseudodesulfovibrio aespoeensis (strain ATCC 700646 / DSM 10631 / Aspo-2) TaxID=643562 RepID=E6VQW8_PSEA9|nr:MULTISPECIES: type II toxin-antitoxin system RelE/ParE family toxin [Pseudodesulfovibrio]MBU4191431.1 type II toxin-antitoxin system RelE/ParE family toxin [Pseudomonadota bacterium]MCG2734547.1 type II toxin-antitoxin system RelE/ParE family toxin [Pseudodesulfovibrio aespoeensis]ADU62948.1 plasmid maintenance system killer [Pseudodesulfovibrio aespoeensis Aspo-2]MBU4243368.1 type II toxin-antitoxin system RelE/ParE family toxin [Pseudomonadota bacterium]MBU4379390.1 type II toxin-antitoxi